MGGEIVGNLLFQPRVNVRVTVAVSDHATRTIEHDIRHTTALGVTEATRLMRIRAEHVGQFLDRFAARNHRLAHHGHA